NRSGRIRSHQNHSCCDAGAKQKRQRFSSLSLCNLADWRNLELLDQPDMPEPSQVIIGSAWIADGVAKLEPKHMWRVLAEYIVHTHGDGRIVQDSLPARHGVSNR